jgi:hypothetical protein
MLAQPIQFFCLNGISNSRNKSLFVSRDPQGSKSLVCLSTALKREAIEKFFKTESDLSPLLENLLETPDVFKFDKCFDNQK